MAVRIDHREDHRRCLQRGRPDRAAARSALVLLLESRGEIDVHGRVASEFHIHVRPEIEAAVIYSRVVIGRRISLEEPVLVVETSGDVIFHGAGSTGDVDVRPGVVAEVLEYAVDPIDIRVKVRILSAQGLAYPLRIEIFSPGSHIVHFHVLCRARHLRHLDWAGHTVLEFDADLWFALLSAACRDEHHAVGSSHSVNGRRGGVLEDGEFLDVLDIHKVKLTLDSVDQDERVGVGSEGADASDPESGSRARLAAPLHRHDSGKPSGESVADLGHRNLHRVRSDCGNGAHDTGLLLVAVADSHSLLQSVSILLKGHVDDL